MFEAVIQVAGVLFGAYMLYVIYIGALAYWPFFLFIIGVILIYTYTFWATILIFSLTICLLTYDHFKKKTLSLNVFISEIIYNSAKFSLAIVVFTLVLNAIFGSANTISVGCSISTPGGC